MQRWLKMLAVGSVLLMGILWGVHAVGACEWKLTFDDSEVYCGCSDVDWNCHGGGKKYWVYTCAGDCPDCKFCLKDWDLGPYTGGAYSLPLCVCVGDGCPTCGPEAGECQISGWLDQGEQSFYGCSCQYW